MYDELGEKVKSFECIEQMKSRVLLDYQSASPTTLPNIRNIFFSAKSRGRVVVTAYFLNQNRFFAHILIPEESSPLVKDVDKLSYQEIENFVVPESANIYEISRNQVSKGLHFGIPPEHEALSRFLLEPIKEHLQPNDIICFIPHRFLHRIPFHALWYNSNTGEYLIEKHPIFYLPSASALKNYTSNRKRYPKTYLGIYTKNLPKAGDEIQKISTLFEDSQIRSEKEMRKELAREMERADLIHLALESEFNSQNPYLSSLILPDSKPFSVHDILNLRLREEAMVILNTCESGMGELSQGDELIGLAWGFLCAGASTVLANLWRVDDEVGSQVIVHFLMHWKQGLSKAEALQRAQINFLAEQRTKAKDEGWDYLPKRRFPSSIKRLHPYFWAPFVLIGDWQ